MSYAPFVEELVKSIVASPSSVEIDEVLEGNTRTFNVRVAQDDVGKVIGKNGRVISAIRLVVSAIASKSKEKAYVKIVTE
ncbi:MAG: KH domain-containing protein [Armatimonadetes bacterium]|nr:KH domain-containing protein [Armatimonadota bacterium]MBS1702449.1 KH domain-containing protein [Armatimonadota bacterium]MBS1725877.1 KH domain-containing protein [Armatimonadota bacterium]